MRAFVKGFSRCQSLLLGLLCVPLLALAQDEPQPLQSDWLELVKGYRDQSSGVEMRDVEYGSEAGVRTVTLAIPKSAMNDPDTIEEVVVVGRRPAKAVPLDITYEWVQDYDKDNYGLIIRLGKNSNWPIRLYLDSAAGYTN
jgi:hypothetical protein